MGVCRYPPPHVIPVKITRRINTRGVQIEIETGSETRSEDQFAIGYTSEVHYIE